jgi:hypothetical protein
MRAIHQSVLGVTLVISLVVSFLVRDEYIGRSVSGIELQQEQTTTTISTITTSPPFFSSFSSYRPKKQNMNNFIYIAKQYISPIYIPYQTIVNECSASPYEMRWPHYVRLPEWATKMEGFFNKEVPRGKHICYCSVGKTAGSSISGLLGFQLHAPDVYFILPGLLPHYTTQQLCRRHALLSLHHATSPGPSAIGISVRSRQT